VLDWAALDFGELHRGEVHRRHPPRGQQLRPRPRRCRFTVVHPILHRV